MAAAFKVRLDDGMEVGPLDGEMLRSWFQQGMIRRDTKIRARGSKQWVRLGDTFDTSDWGTDNTPASASARAAARAAGAESSDDEDDDADFDDPGAQTWRTFVACGVFFLLAAAAGYFSIFPAVWRTPENVPWREISLGFLVLGMLLVRGWDPARKIVRVLVLILTLGLFPLAEVLVFKGVPWRSLMVLAPAVAMGFGLFFLLSARYKPWTRIALNLFWVLAGAAGVVMLGAFPPPPVAEWMSAPSHLPAALAPAMLPGSGAMPASAAVVPSPMVASDADRVGAADALPSPAAPATMPSPAATETAAAAAAEGAPSAAAVIQEVPLLSPAAAEAVRRRAVFAPEDAFRRSYEMAGSGVAALSAGERKALGELMARAYGNIPDGDRRRLEAYMAAIRGGQVSSTEQNREMSALMREATRKLPALQRSQLQALYEKAILAAR